MDGSEEGPRKVLLLGSLRPNLAPGDASSRVLERGNCARSHVERAANGTGKTTLDGKTWTLHSKISVVSTPGHHPKLLAKSIIYPIYPPIKENIEADRSPSCWSTEGSSFVCPKRSSPGQLPRTIHGNFRLALCPAVCVLQWPCI